MERSMVKVWAWLLAVARGCWPDTAVGSPGHVTQHWFWREVSLLLVVAGGGAGAGTGGILRQFINQTTNRSSAACLLPPPTDKKIYTFLTSKLCTKATKPDKNVWHFCYRLISSEPWLQLLIDKPRPGSGREPGNGGGGQKAVVTVGWCRYSRYWAGGAH